MPEGRSTSEADIRRLRSIERPLLSETHRCSRPVAVLRSATSRGCNARGSGRSKPARDTEAGVGSNTGSPRHGNVSRTSQAQVCCSKPARACSRNAFEDSGEVRGFVEAEFSADLLDGRCRIDESALGFQHEPVLNDQFRTEPAGHHATGAQGFRRTAEPVREVDDAIALAEAPFELSLEARYPARCRSEEHTARNTGSGQRCQT